MTRLPAADPRTAVHPLTALVVAALEVFDASTHEDPVRRPPERTRVRRPPCDRGRDEEA